MRRIRSRSALLIAMVAMIGTVASTPLHPLRAATASPDFPQSQLSHGQAPAESEFTLYIPLIALPEQPLVTASQWRSPFGVQVGASLAAGDTLSQTVALGSSWVRLGDRISWRALQPNEGDPIKWELLADFELELRALKKAGITPVVIINYFPRWATIQPNSCAAIRSDKLAAFAQFMRALVNRYQSDEFNVHHWEFGNEPDVDPKLVGTDNAWGCWGNSKDQFYGGRQYGEMLKVVSPAVKAADPQAQVWIGGLLLERPDSNPKQGRPELFLQGILEAGAAPFFDVVPYHVYADFENPLLDADTTDGWVWKPWGGRIVGKARFLKQLMAGYGVDKPVVANEIGLLWCSIKDNCPPPGPFFDQAQANFVVRSLVRGIGGGVEGFFWYILDYPGFRFSGMLDVNGAHRPVYTAYQQLVRQLDRASYIQPIDYGVGIEAYAFRRGPEQLHVVWTTDVTTMTLTIPQDHFLRAFDRDGHAITAVSDGLNVQLAVGFAPIYLFRRP